MRPGRGEDAGQNRRSHWDSTDHSTDYASQPRSSAAEAEKGKPAHDDAVPAPGQAAAQASQREVDRHVRHRPRFDDALHHGQRCAVLDDVEHDRERAEPAASSGAVLAREACHLAEVRLIFWFPCGLHVR